MDFTGADLSGYLERIYEVNNCKGRDQFVQFFVGEALVGYMKPECVHTLLGASALVPRLFRCARWAERAERRDAA